jgi:hypothetical protein
MDQYALGPTNHSHRKVLHHREGVEVGVMLFGDDSRKFLEQHVMDDYKTNKIPTIAELCDLPGFQAYHAHDIYVYTPPDTAFMKFMKSLFTRREV